MKQHRSLVFVVALSFAGVGLVALSGCKKQEATPASAPKPGVPPPVVVVSAEKTSFQQVTSKLEPGGNLYLYLGTEQWLEGLSRKMGEWRKLVGAIPDVKSKERAQIEKVFDIVTNLVQRSGIEDVSGFGMSAIAIEKGLYRSKSVLHHYSGKGAGFLWSLFGQKPHGLEGLNLLSTNAALAGFVDVDVPALWSGITAEVKKAGVPQVQQGLAKVPEAFEKATGLKLEKVLASLGGEFGFVVILDDAKKVSLPVQGESLEFPEPGLLLIAKVRDDTIFDRVERELTNKQMQVVRVDKPGLRMRTVPLPLPLPFQLRPTLASAGGYLFLATTDALVQEALAVRAGQTPGLKSTAEFRRLAQGVPVEGNQFAYMSRRFGGALMDMQRKALLGNDKTPEAIKSLLQGLFVSDDANCAYSVGANTDEGWVTVATGNQSPAKMLLLSATAVPAAVFAAVAIPNFTRAKQTAQQKACINNLRQIDGAKQQWALEMKKAETETPMRSDLLKYFSGQAFPACPAGGSYTMNPVGTRPRCSIPGHVLPE
jgi:hypothetical protein